MRVVAGRARAFVLVLAVSTVFAAGAVDVRALLAPSAQGSSPQQNQTGAEAPLKPTGFVLGQVVDSSTARPIAGAMVTLSGTGTSQTNAQVVNGEVLIGSAISGGGASTSAPRQVLTDSSGRFLFRELGKGRYSIRATSPGYVAAGYGQTKSLGPSQLIEFGRDDEKRADIVLKLWKTATVSGTIVDEAGEPVIGLSVRVFNRQRSGGRLRLIPGQTATTDDRGAFRFTDLAPGDYLVGIISTQTTVPVATTEAYAQEMSAGTSFINSDIYRDLSSSGAPSVSSPGYRVGDLTLQIPYGRGNPGSSPPPTPTDNGQLLLYPTQFFPAARSTAQAAVVTLEAGQNRPGVDFQLKLVPTVRVSGTIAGPDGPVRNFGLRLLPAGLDDFTSDSGLEAASTVTDGQGAFTFLGVTPGEYTLKALRVPRSRETQSPMTSIEVSGPNGVMMGISTSAGPAPTAPLPTEPALWATTSVTVGDGNVSGLALSLRPGARISGHFVFDGGKDPPPADQLQRGSITVSPLGGGITVQLLLSARRIETDGRFATTGYPPGLYNVTASLPPGPPGGPGGVGAPVWTFKSATLGGRNVSDEGLEIGSEDISDLVITFTDQPCELSGTVVDSGGKLDAAASVILIPADSQAWRQGVMNSRRVRNVRATTAGSFITTGLSPGRYVAVAVADAAVDDWQDPKILEKLFPLGTPITINDGEKKTLALTTKVVR